MGHSRFFLLSAVCFALCGALRADFAENFAPPREFHGKAEEFVTLARDYRLDPRRGATFVVTGLSIASAVAAKPKPGAPPPVNSKCR